MKYLVVTALALILVGCETIGNKRQNGTNTDHVNAKLKNVTIAGNLTIGGGTQNTSKASQEGLGRVDADAKVEDSVNGQEKLLETLVVPEMPPEPADLTDPLPESD